ncbi:MAG: threonylcarbamoyl-AMP synthase, partial [Muribaculaceae bacterium]|nr:threonylcarbamoyl-AMP synthase [Muribaculaceae bacterium]
MKILTIYPNSVNQRHIDDAVEALRRGEIIVYPTDTFYALGADALNNRAVERLCRLKGINPDKNLLSVVCSGLSQAAEYARIDNRAFRLMKENLPGAFTFILPASSSLPKVFKSRKTVGVRVPDNAIACALAESLGNPVMSASVPLGDSDDALAEASDPRALGLRYSGTPEVTLVIDGGDGGSEGSTSLDCLDSAAPEIIRQ